MLPKFVILTVDKAGSYKSFAHMHQIKRRHITEDRNLNIDGNEKHISFIASSCSVRRNDLKPNL
jgi:hypothetical protein